jgi:hypothetical protein
MVEEKVLAGLASVSGYRLEGARLTVFFNNGRGSIVFTLGAASVPGTVTAGMPRTGAPDDSAPILPLALLALALAVSGLTLKLRRNNG